MTDEEIGEDEKPITRHEIEVPPWIEQDISPNDVAAIVQGGCESGAYMPAVTYGRALATMAEYGDDVLDYIEGEMGELPSPPDPVSWSGLACRYLSAAVELWAQAAYSELERIETESDDD